jgi:hypothetical protein
MIRSPNRDGTSTWGVPYLGASDERSLDEQNAEALRLSVVEELLGENLDLPLLCEP